MKNLKNSFAFLGLLTFIVFMAAACRKAPNGVTISSDVTTIATSGIATISAEVDGDFSWIQWYVILPGSTEAIESTGMAGPGTIYPLVLDSTTFNAHGTGNYTVYAKARNCRGNKDLSDDCKNTTQSNEIVITVTP